MKKKISVIFALVACVFAFASCGSTDNSTYGGRTTKELEAESENLASQVVSLSESDLKQYYESYKKQATSDPDNDEYKMYETMFQNFVDNEPGLGEFVDYAGFKVDKAGKNITTTLTMKYQKRNATLVIVYKSYNMSKPTSINFNPVYSLGETMGKAALNVVMGMVTVFAVLILISLVIYCFNLIPYLQKKFAAKKAPQAQTKQIVEAGESAPAGEEDSEELIAVISAAISAATGASTDSFVVRSIKRRY
ncbi:MAG: OadG family transporter subunit [Candidatus Weimeria sp.]